MANNRNILRQKEVVIIYKHKIITPVQPDESGSMGGSPARKGESKVYGFKRNTHHM
jgi:hypothetical protein